MKKCHRIREFKLPVEYCKIAYYFFLYGFIILEHTSNISHQQCRLTVEDEQG